MINFIAEIAAMHKPMFQVIAGQIMMGTQSFFQVVGTLEDKTFNCAFEFKDDVMEMAKNMETALASILDNLYPRGSSHDQNEKRICKTV